MRTRTGLPRIPLRMAQFALLASIATTALSTTRAAAGDVPPTAPSGAVLHLTDGNFAAGELENSAKPGILRWRATPFVSPFEFPLNSVNAIHWPRPATLAKPGADYCFELAGGDVVFGSLVALDGKQAELDVPRIGRLHVERSHVNRIYRWRDSADLIYLGPNGLHGWTETSPARATTAAMRQEMRLNGQPVPKASDPPPAEKSWREESGQLVTEKEGAAIGGDFNIPARASIEFEISWKNKPDFVLALGVNDADRSNSSKRAFRFEVWGGDMVVQRELDHEADLAVVQELAPGPGRAHLQVYLDQEKGRILVFSQAGKRLADLKVASPIPTVLPGLSLANVRGDLRLEALRIGRWSGELPRDVKADEARIHRADGSIDYGNVTRFDPVTKEFVIRGETGESRIAPEKVTSVFISQPTDEPPRAIRAIYQDGARLSGDLERVENGSIRLKLPGVEESLSLPVAGLRSLLTLRHEPTNAPARQDSPGRLEMDGLRLPGRLVDGKAQDGASCLVWHPVGSETASALRPGVTGRIVYRDPPPPSATTQVTMRNGVRIVGRAPVQPPQAQGVGGMVMRFTQALNERPPAKDQPVREPRSLYLRDGDVIPSVIVNIDERGVTFKTSISASTFVPHDKVKAVELSPDQSVPTTVRLTKSKQDRLLTLPRMQKPDPPTQLIRSKNGDYLRGRLIGMDDKKLQVEIHLETKELPRDRIARIIWLHADEFDESKKPAKSSDPNATRVQVMRNDGVRLTFLAQNFANSTLSGTSDVLGPCAVALKEMDQLLIGSAIDKAAATLIYQQWKLKNAPEPKYVTAADEGADGGGNGTGVESPLVGKPAPDFELALLGGKKFHLADARGKVVVLDFWATWCGPCLQAMPQVERATESFKDQDVQLIAVNLQETPDQITAMLERHKFKMTVALDRDGIVAEKYKAAAIPQTVIIQRDGSVARLFIGGGARFEDQLREAIKAVLAGDKPKEKK